MQPRTGLSPPQCRRSGCQLGATAAPLPNSPARRGGDGVAHHESTAKGVPLYRADSGRTTETQRSTAEAHAGWRGSRLEHLPALPRLRRRCPVQHRSLLRYPRAPQGKPACRGRRGEAGSGRLSPARRVTLLGAGPGEARISLRCPPPSSAPLPLPRPPPEKGLLSPGKRDWEQLGGRGGRGHPWLHPFPAHPGSQQNPGRRDHKKAVCIPPPPRPSNGVGRRGPWAPSRMGLCSPRPCSPPVPPP